MTDWARAQIIRRAMHKREQPEQYCPGKKCLRSKGQCPSHCTTCGLPLPEGLRQKNQQCPKCLDVPYEIPTDADRPFGADGFRP